MPGKKAAEENNPGHWRQADLSIFVLFLLVSAGDKPRTCAGNGSSTQLHPLPAGT
jgi:hypothetical protein